MTPFDKLLQFLTRTWRIDMLILSKIGVLVFLVLYLVFSLVVVKQIRLMSKTINGMLEKTLLTGAYGLVGLAVVVLILAMIVL